MPYRIINDDAAVASRLLPYITPEEPEICRCETTEEISRNMLPGWMCLQ
jgi:hypothetical protein